MPREGGMSIECGTKHFFPGTKVYCLPVQWGDGYEQIVVIGRHSGSPKLCRMIISHRFITNWRAQAVHSPAVHRLMDKETRISLWEREVGRPRRRLRSGLSFLPSDLPSKNAKTMRHSKDSRNKGMHAKPDRPLFVPWNPSSKQAIEAHQPVKYWGSLNSLPKN